MYQKEILKIIYNNYKYEYLIVNKDFEIIDFSSYIFDFLNVPKSDLKTIDIFELLPELIGMEEEFDGLFHTSNTSFVIPNIFKSPSSYLNIHLSAMLEKERVIILLEDVSQNVERQRTLTQERNEKALLVSQIAQKNRQLEAFNEKMQELVEIEINKNLEKQKMFELQSRHAQMGEMIAMITHQWKQPLNVISLVAGMIKLKFPLGKLDGKSVQKATDKISKQIKYMNQTIYDFQEFFNPLKDKTKFNLKNTLLKVIELVRYEYEIKEISLELIEHKNVDVFGFPNEYNQVILSLLINAKEAFLSNPHNNMKITMIIDTQNEKSIVRIRDNAGGIPLNIIDTIFDIYMTTKPTGSGLGLNISKSIIEKNMNGKLMVSNVEDGAEFSIIL